MVMTVGSATSGFLAVTVRFCALFIVSVASVGRLIGTRQPSVMQVENGAPLPSARSSSLKVTPGSICRPNGIRISPSACPSFGVRNSMLNRRLPVRRSPCDWMITQSVRASSRLQFMVQSP